MDSGKQIIRNIGRFAIAALCGWLILQCLIEACTVDEKETQKGLVVSQPDPEF